jgi:hypothetical protein
LHVVEGSARTDPALRLKRFRDEHPYIEVSWSSPWEAVIPEPDGAQRVVVRYELDELLDEVERRLAITAGETAVEG